MQVDQHVEAVRPGVRREFESAATALLHDAPGDRQPAEHRVRLVLGQAVVLEQRQQLVPAAVQLAASDGRADAPAQLGHAVPVVHVERLLEPGDAQLVAAVCKGRGALEVPVRIAGEQRHRPALIGIDADDEVITHRRAHAAHQGEVLLQRRVLHPDLHRRKALGADLVQVAPALVQRLERAARGVDAHLRDGRLLFLQQLVDRLAGAFAGQVPASGLEPPVAPAEVGRLAQPLAEAVHVVGRHAEQEAPEQVAEAAPLGGKGRAGGLADQAIAGEKAGEGLCDVGLRIAWDPRGPERLGERHVHVPQLDALDAIGHGAPPAAARQRCCRGPAVTIP